jgi:hypothetical protein
MTALLLTLLTVLAADTPVKIKFEAQATPEPMNPKTYRALTHDEVKDLEAAIKQIPGCQDVATSASTFTVTVAPEKTVTLYELRMAVKGVQNARNTTFKIMLNSIKLDGKILLKLKVAQNQDKVKDVLKGCSGLSDVKETGDGYECKAGGADLLGIVKTVCAMTGNGKDFLHTIEEIGRASCRERVSNFV